MIMPKIAFGKGNNFGKGMNGKGNSGHKKGSSNGSTQRPRSKFNLNYEESPH